jgi:type VI secretion system protein ImpL
MARAKTKQLELVGVKAYQDHQSALTEIAPVSNSRKLAFDMASQVYSEDKVTGKSPFFTAHQAIVKLKSSMGGGEKTQEIFGKLMAGPVDYLWTYVRAETACQLQEQWDQEVLAEVEGAPNWQELVLGQEGYGSKFVKGPASPFIGRSTRKGYYARTALGGKIAFEPDFFSFLKKGARVATTVRENYKVRVKGLPTGANPGARLPRLTRLELQCGGEVQSLVNRNYPVSDTFSWAPRDCGDVVFTIEVGAVTLTKTYTGHMPFAEFLNDFRKGKRTFNIDEFPNQKAALRRMGIKYITVTYQFSGHEPVLGLRSAGPGRLPKEIVTCWDQ